MEAQDYIRFYKFLEYNYTWCSVSDDEVTETVEEIKENLIKMEKNTIASNALDKVSPHYFQKLPNLKYLTIYEVEDEPQKEKTSVYEAALNKLLSLLPNIEELVLKGFLLYSLPPALCKLKKLKYLRFIGGVTRIPDEISQLTELDFLRISCLDSEYYPCVEYIPDSIGQLSKLNALQLYSLRTDYIPQSIGYLPKLESLALEASCFFPESIQNLHQLKELYITTYPKDPDAIFKMGEDSYDEAIEERKAYMQRLEVIRSLKNLKILKLNSTMIDYLPEWIGDFLHLEALTLDSVGEFAAFLGGELLQFPATLKNLKKLKARAQFRFVPNYNKKVMSVSHL